MMRHHADPYSDVTKMRTYSLRVWPNGEFGLGIVKRFSVDSPEDSQDKLEDNPFPNNIRGANAYYQSLEKAVEAFVPGYYQALMEEISNDETGDPLGLSNDPISHKRKKRGSGGLTSYAKRMIRNGSYLLEKWAGRRRIAMVTVTLPSVPPDIEKELTHEWAEILRTFTQYIHRKLKAANICPWVLGAVEIQEKRLQKYGGLPIHAHLVFQSRLGKGYILSVGEVRDAWKRACCSRVPACDAYSFDASTRIEKVKKSVAAYLSKYLSKGVSPAVEAAIEQGYKLPTSWWVGVGQFKKSIARLMICTTGEDASMVHDAIHDFPELFKYVGRIYIGVDGEERCVGWFGVVNRDLHRILSDSAIGRKMANQNVLVKGIDT